jgi:hypothetical protein
MSTNGPGCPSRMKPSLHKSFGSCLLAPTLSFFTPQHIYSASAETLSSTTSAPSRIGPGFDCSKAVTPLGLMICGNDGLPKLDLEFVQAYQALRQQVGDGGVSQLREEAVEFQNTTLSICGIPEQGEVAGSSDCLRNQYSKQRAIWVSRLSGAAHEEVTRPIDLHIMIQKKLQELGYLPATATIDGVYGPATRTAIAAWQNSVGHPTDGFMSNIDAALILQKSSNIPSANTTTVLPSPPPVAQAEPPPPPPKPVPKPRPKPMQPVDRPPAEMTLPPTAPAPQVASLPPPVQAPVISADYRSMLSTWLDSHKRYPQGRPPARRGRPRRAALSGRPQRPGARLRGGQQHWLCRSRRCRRIDDARRDLAALPGEHDLTRDRGIGHDRLRPDSGPCGPCLGSPDRSGSGSGSESGSGAPAPHYREPLSTEPRQPGRGYG